MIGNTTNDIYGGGYGAGLGGALGGVGLIGLVGLDSLLGRGKGGFGGGNEVGTNIVEAEQIGDLRHDVEETKCAALGAATTIQTNLLEQIIGLNSQFSNTNNLLFGLDKSIMGTNNLIGTTALQQTIASMQNTQSIKDQAATNQNFNQENFCSLRSAIANEAEKTRALITSNEIGNLRDELAAERRTNDRQHSDLTITQTVNQAQSQSQSQFQTLGNQLGSALGILNDQIARQNNSIVNLGSMSGSAGTQANTSANTKVH